MIQPLHQPLGAVADVGLRGIDHLEVWVGNALQATHFHRSALGFDEIAYLGPETGVADRVSHVLRQGDIHLVLTSALEPGHPIARHVRRHGDGVRAVAFDVVDAAAAHEVAVARGACSAAPPRRLRDDGGEVVLASIAAYGDTVHTFVTREHHDGPWLPGYVGSQRPAIGGGVGLTAVDHVVANVEQGGLASWGAWYVRVLGMHALQEFTRDEVSSHESGLSSRVYGDVLGKVTLPINEPGDGERRSQVQEFLDAYGGAGIQHLALATNDIVATVTAMRARGIGFLAAPDGYHERTRNRLGEIGVPWGQLEDLGIMVDKDGEGHLLQIFTRPLQDRPTLFLEIIQREGAIGFGAGNFAALFQALEAEQDRRGNL